MSSLMLAKSGAVHSRAPKGFKLAVRLTLTHAGKWSRNENRQHPRRLKEDQHPLMMSFRPEPLQDTSCLLLIQLIKSANWSDWESRVAMKRLKGIRGGVAKVEATCIQAIKRRMFPFSSICLLRFLEIRHNLHFLSRHRCHPRNLQDSPQPLTKPTVRLESYLQTRLQWADRLPSSRRLYNRITQNVCRRNQPE